MLEAFQDWVRGGPFLVAAVAAFVSGVLSFFLPCVLPLVPAYLSFVSGVSIQDMKAMSAVGSLRRVVGRTGAFILGFGAVYTALGAAAGAVGGALDILNSPWVARAAGVLLIVLGVHLTGLVKIGALYRERRFHIESRPASAIAAFLVGVAFAFGWSPCVGPVVAAILGLAGAQETVGRGVFLLAVYSLGLGVPFMVSAIAINLFLGIFERVKRFLRVIEIVSGAILVALGLLLALDWIDLLLRYLSLPES